MTDNPRDGWMNAEDGVWVRQANPVTVFRDSIGWRIKTSDNRVLQHAFASAEDARLACDHGKIREVLPRFEA